MPRCSWDDSQNDGGEAMVGSDGERRTVISIGAVGAAGDIQLPDFDRYGIIFLNNKRRGMRRYL